MKNFKVRNYRGISSADINLDKITLISGLNDTGKTSTIEAIMCAATGQPNPFKSVTAKQASMLVHSGAPSGSSEYISGENVSTVKYPTLEYSSNKQPVLISDIAAGIKSMVDFSIPDRINYVVKMMGAEPTIEDLADELIKAGLIPESEENPTKTDLSVKLWEAITINGWDNAAKSAREKGIKLKGIWEDTTGNKKYGKRIAETWIPEGWSAELAGVGEDKLTAIVKDCRELFEAGIKETSITEFEQSQLQQKVDNLPEIQKQIVDKEKAVSDCNANIDIIRSNMAEKQRSELAVMKCPECGQALDLKSGGLVKTDRKPKQPEDVSGLQCEIEGWVKTKTNHFMEIGALKSKLAESIEARTKLKEIQDAPKKSSLSIDDLRNNLSLAESNLSAYISYNKALKAHNNIETNAKLVTILEPTGIRNKKLTEAYSKINASLKIITDKAGWKLVELNQDCEIMYGGFPYKLTSKSGRYRTKILLQIMLARAEKSEFMIIDDLDELVESVRSKMINIILRCGVPCIAVAAMNDKNKVSEISGKLKNLGGKCYWVENSVAVEV